MEKIGPTLVDENGDGEYGWQVEVCNMPTCEYGRGIAVGLTIDGEQRMVEFSQ